MEPKPPTRKPTTSHYTRSHNYRRPLQRRRPRGPADGQVGSLLLQLPIELVLYICRFLRYADIATLSTTCRLCHALCENKVWGDVIRSENAENHHSAFQFGLYKLPITGQARHHVLTNEHWRQGVYQAYPLNAAWRKTCHSKLALSHRRLAIAGGNTIYCYRFKSNETNQVVEEEITFSVGEKKPQNDITGIFFVPDQDEDMLITDWSGRLSSFRLSDQEYDSKPHQHNKRHHSILPAQTKLIHQHPKAAGITGLDVAGKVALTISVSGHLSVHHLGRMDTSEVQVGNKGWSCHLELASSTPYAAVGHQTGVTIVPFHSGVLHSASMTTLGWPTKPTPTYALSSFLPGHSPNILVAGQWDGKVRVFDLRTPTRSTGRHIAIMTLSDPWRSFDPIYSLATRGVPSASPVAQTSHAHHIITAGSSLHSTVLFWDVRSPSKGFTVYAPGKDRGSVYALKAEGSRLWGSTECRGFVLDFGVDRVDSDRKLEWPRIRDGDQHEHRRAAKYTHSSY